MFLLLFIYPSVESTFSLNVNKDREPLKKHRLRIGHPSQDWTHAHLCRIWLIIRNLRMLCRKIELQGGRSFPNCHNSKPHFGGDFIASRAWPFQIWNPETPVFPS